MSSNMAANTNHTIYFVDKSKCHKISPLNAFPLKFRVQDNFYVHCQILTSARFQLIVEKKHWSRDFLVQLATDDVTENLFSLFCSTWRAVLRMLVRLFRIKQVKAS